MGPGQNWPIQLVYTQFALEVAFRWWLELEKKKIDVLQEMSQRKAVQLATWLTSVLMFFMAQSGGGTQTSRSTGETGLASSRHQLLFLPPSRYLLGLFIFSIKTEGDLLSDCHGSQVGNVGKCICLRSVWVKFNETDLYWTSLCIRHPLSHGIQWQMMCNFRLPWWFRGKESSCKTGDAGDTGSIPG